MLIWAMDEAHFRTQKRPPRKFSRSRCIRSFRPQAVAEVAGAVKKAVANRTQTAVSR